MERLRPPRPDQDSSLETIAPMPARASLAELLEAVRSPGVLNTDVDALLRALVRPLTEDETPRSRADLLLSLIESQEMRELQGSNGRTVRAAAVKALLNLGYPYALEVPPEALAEAQLALEARPQEIPIAGLIATGVGLLAHISYFMPDVLGILQGTIEDSLLLTLLRLSVALGPAASVVLGGWLRIRWLQWFGIVTMGGAIGIWFTSFLEALEVWRPFSHSKTWISLVAMLGLLLGTILMRRPEWLAPGASPSKDTPPKAQP